MEPMLKLLKQAFGGRLVGNTYMKDCVVLAVSKLPDKYYDKIVKNTWFLSSDEDSWGYAFNGDDLKGKHLIFLSDVLFQEPKEQILYTILHEIAHVILGHKNSIEHKQSKPEIESQEKTADEFAKKYLI